MQEFPTDWEITMQLVSKAKDEVKETYYTRDLTQVLKFCTPYCGAQKAYRITTFTRHYNEIYERKKDYNFLLKRRLVKPVTELILFIHLGEKKLITN